ncbi:multi-sensor hybrid histidine kinase [Calothrix sp. NIES-4071]|nr:multi-sensor hybrid histidine kinase [Calothrix sp. NIES-4071]BAZ60439.1 multi-sensor hybrid histidine kinase [Calothrix sp. NIES-4105]
MVYQKIKTMLFTCTNSELGIVAKTAIRDFYTYSNKLEEILEQASTNNYIQIIEKFSSFDKLLLGLQNSTLDINAVILDLCLNNIYDLDYISQTHTLKPNVIIIVVSDKGDDDFFQAAFAAGADDYLIKSEMTPQSLLWSLKRTVEQRKQKSLEYLSENETQLRAIFERSPIGIGLLDREARLIDVNPALCQILGYDYEELCSKQLIDFICESEIQTESKLNYQFTNSQERFEMERQFLHKDGRLVWAHLNVSLVTSALNEPNFYLAMVEEITDRKRTELKLRESKEAAEAGSKAKSAFLATMSHELRTPLNAIMGLSQLLQQEVVGSLNEKQREYINCIYTSGEHLLALINDILDLSKVEAGREDLTLVSLSVNDIVRNVISTLLESANLKKLQLVHNIDEGLDTCIADERRLKQMLLNLLTNAIKFTTVGTISLEVKRVEQGIAFIITDTGIGIEPSNFKSLFEPFRQLDNRLNRQYEGTGLGLALTRKLARLHGGDLTVESTLGVGSRFSLLLPAQPQHENISNNTNLSELTAENSTHKVFVYPNTFSKQAAKRILLVEDEEHTAILMQDYLQTIGYEVELMVTGERFIARVITFKPNLILLDVHLPGDVNGFDLLVSIKQKQDLKEIPVVVMTPMGIGDREKFLQAGAIDCLSKPIGIFQLESVLVKYL